MPSSLRPTDRDGRVSCSSRKIISFFSLPLSPSPFPDDDDTSRLAESSQRVSERANAHRRRSRLRAEESLAQTSDHRVVITAREASKQARRTERSESVHYTTPGALQSLQWNHPTLPGTFCFTTVTIRLPVGSSSERDNLQFKKKPACMCVCRSSVCTERGAP